MKTQSNAFYLQIVMAAFPSVANLFPREKGAGKNILEVNTARAWLPVIRCGKGCQDNVTAINANHIGNRLEYIEIKMRVSRH